MIATVEGIVEADHTPLMLWAYGSCEGPKDKGTMATGSRWPQPRGLDAYLMQGTFLIEN